MNTPTAPWKIWIDTGGTFTDCLAVDPAGTKTRIKILSSGRLRGRITRKIGPAVFEFDAPWLFTDQLLKGYIFSLRDHEETSRVVSINFSNKTLIIAEELPDVKQADFEIYSGEEAPVLAARLLTQTPLRRPLPPVDMRLGTTRGTNALLERKGARTLLVVTKGFKDLLYISNQQRPSLFQLNIPEPPLLYSDILEIDARMDEKGEILAPFVPESLSLNRLQDYDSVAISLLHAYKNDVHEKAVENLLKEKGAMYVSASAALYPFSHYLRRTQTTMVNAYLDPVLDQYLSSIGRSLGHGGLRVMTSSGSLSATVGFRAKDSLLSGPAGGIVAAANAAQRLGFSKVLTFDMGGTSTDTARIDGVPELKYITQIDGIEFHNPTLAIETVAAGGGSVCWFDGFSLQVGPQSAGAAPGPACYGAGGPLTITDVNLLLGKLDSGKFGIPINPGEAKEKLAGLQQSIYSLTGNYLSQTEILKGLEQIANEKMADAIKKISVAKGIDPADYTLFTFGGAGGLHSCQLADLLDIKSVVIPYDAGLFSAVGIGEALISSLSSRQLSLPWNEVESDLEQIIAELHQEGILALGAQHVTDHEVAFCSVFLRFAGQENAVEVPYEREMTRPAFRALYTSQFGYYPESGIIEIESIRLMVRQKAAVQTPLNIKKSGTRVPPSTTDNVLLNGSLYEWDKLAPGSEITSPAILLNNTSTTYLPDGWKLIIQENMDAVAFRDSPAAAADETQSEEVALQLFTNRFESIAEEMGAQLQRTAFSVNVKERLDFSCALVDPDGELLVNAQHIPVHLGSMGICTRLVKAYIEIGPGDVIITNHPRYGGSHLPDITLIAGVFTVEKECIGYVINRAHHAEIGGKTPGSMPPDATSLAEEGVVILPQYLVREGVFQWELIRELFNAGPFPTRSYATNEADIIAALSALQKGSSQLLLLVEQHGLPVVRKHMQLLKQSAAKQLKAALTGYEGKVFEASEALDDGHLISVKISITSDKQLFDFSGTSGVHPNNLNANLSILYSAILYVLRLLVNKEIPLNDGLMKNVEIKLPDNSFLHPVFSDDVSLCPAVVGGNTEVSQRLVDTLLKAFGLAACSQGTMNNFLFGNEHFGYYETIGGGVGAGPGFAGRSTVHQHMTNTRITDPEQMELKYPVRLLEFGIRKNSGGKGLYRGGNGMIRKIQFLKPLQVTLLGQHRTIAPYGLQGGHSGKCGKHTLATGNIARALPGICSLRVNTDDILTIETPGGGGYGQTL
ncbi:hypothetical protein DYBT9275_00154 [Dyadobacter sp. CECT 9275]|uniref:5-oxoprolinase n=1 Tax=Dyadobacter helix TaxID=2822344 RepID=A0A916NJD3_9BACT|nr:hydantoinase B/oxoprolinase family protein [Dyadobacter sp. CECT 9275]CAG4988768.1 hypothetical protein DYBT9275_00154 [Dyadobacter sp. CECT 9275]